MEKVQQRQYQFRQLSTISSKSSQIAKDMRRVAYLHERSQLLEEMCRSGEYDKLGMGFKGTNRNLAISANTSFSRDEINECLYVLLCKINDELNVLVNKYNLLGIGELQ